MLKFSTAITVWLCHFAHIFIKCLLDRLSVLRFLLRRIEEELGDQARFAGHNFRNPSALWDVLWLQHPHIRLHQTLCTDSDRSRTNKTTDRNDILHCNTHPRIILHLNTYWPQSYPTEALHWPTRTNTQLQLDWPLTTALIICMAELIRTRWRTWHAWDRDS